MIDIDGYEMIGNTDDQSFFLKDLTDLKPFYVILIETQQYPQDSKWKWEPNGLFSTRSTYKVRHHSGVLCQHYRRLWKIKCPPKVKVFLWVLLQNKLLTREMLARRGCNIVQGCLLCRSDTVESALHLFWTCPYAKEFWSSILREISMGITTGGARSHIRVWKIQMYKLDARGRKRWEIAWAAGLWAL